MVGIIVSGGAAPRHFPMEISRENSWVVAADSGFEHLQGWGLQPNLLIGDLDSIDSTNQNLKNGSPSFAVIKLNPEKDISDTEAALLECRKRNLTEVSLIGGGGGRFDHWYANFLLLEAFPEVRVWYQAEGKMVRIDGEVTFQNQPGRVCSIINSGRGPWQIQSQGLQWELDDFSFDKHLSLSNVVRTEVWTLRPIQGHFWVYFPD